MKEKESQILAAICDYLALRKYFFWRQNTTPVFSEGRFFRMPKHSKTGVPDILLVKSGILWGLEVKRPTGQISASQKEFKEGLEAAGGLYHVVRSIDDVVALGL